MHFNKMSVTSAKSAASTQTPKEKRFNFLVVIHKIFKRFTGKDSSSNSETTTKSLLYLQEIKQNEANEMLLKAGSHQQQPYVVAIETAVGIFYWDCGLQPDTNLAEMDLRTQAY